MRRVDGAFDLQDQRAAGGLPRDLDVEQPAEGTGDLESLAGHRPRLRDARHTLPPLQMPEFVRVRTDPEAQTGRRASLAHVHDDLVARRRVERGRLPVRDSRINGDHAADARRGRRNLTGEVPRGGMRADPLRRQPLQFAHRVGAERPLQHLVALQRPRRGGHDVRAALAQDRLKPRPEHRVDGGQRRGRVFQGAARLAGTGP